MAQAVSLLTFTLIYGIAATFIIMGMVFLIMFSGKWFRFGLKAKWKARKGYGVVVIDEPDGLHQEWTFADFAKPYFQINGENVAYAFNHKKDKVHKGLTFAFFDRYIAGQKGNQNKIEYDAISFDVKDESPEGKSALQMLQFWKRAEKKEISETEIYYYVQQKEGPQGAAVKEYPEGFSSAVFDNFLNMAKQIGEMKALNQNSGIIMALLFVVIVMCGIVIYQNYKNGGLLKYIASWIGEQIMKASAAPGVKI